MGAVRAIRLAVVVGLAGCIALAGAQAAAAAVEQPPEYLSSFGPDGNEASGFERARGVAVDETEELVYVIDEQGGSILKFDLEGQPVSFSGSAAYISGNRISGLSFSNEFGRTQVAVDPNSHDIYVTSGNSVTAFHSDGESAKFTEGPGAGTNAIGGFERLQGVAVDAQGNIYASDTLDGMVKIFAPTGALITQFSSTLPANLAVDAKGRVYVTLWLGNPLGTIRRYTPSKFPIGEATTYAEASEPLTTEKSYALAVDATSNDVYVPYATAEPKVVQYDENGNVVSSFAGPGEEGALTLSEGVAVHGGKGLIFVSDQPSEGLSQVKIFKIFRYAGPPRIDTMSVSAVAADHAVLHAELNPGSAETTYSFEYGLADCAVSACASVPLGGGTIAADYKVVEVSQPITGLQAGTTYHYRLVAENENGEEVGAAAGDHVFTTQGGVLDFSQIDERAWELVTPPNKGSGVLTSITEGLIQAARDQSGMVYLSKNPVVAGADGSRSPEINTTLARRGGNGWISEDITPPNQTVVPFIVGFQGTYRLFSPDLTRAVLEPMGSAPLSPQASERTPYLRANNEPSTYTPLVTSKEGFANVFEGAEFGGLEQSAPVVRIVGATSSLEHVVLVSAAALGAPGDPLPSLYRWAGSKLRPVNVLPVSEGGTMTASNLIGSGPGSVRNAISQDGSRVFWSTGNYDASNANSLTGLYLRDMVAEETGRLDVKQPGASGAGVARPIFQGASPDGTVAYFTDSQQLTSDASPSGFDLYRCEIPPESSPPGCATLTDISAPLPESGESSEVQGILPGLSEDGSSLYFVAKGVLDAEPNKRGESAVGKESNLYRWSEAEGTRFVATLASEDSRDWGVSAGQVGVTFKLSAASSPSGRYLGFMSERSLTGFDNRDVTSGNRTQQAYRYDAASEELVCVSCNATGAKPTGFRGTNYVERIPLIDPQRLWPERWLAADFPQATTARLNGFSLYQPRFVLDNGRVFFNSYDGLVPADANNQWDAYQYESFGVGDCSESAADAATTLVGGGCVSLISSGTAEEEAAVLDASASGDDVYFFSGARLAGNDTDEEIDIYDARVDGVPVVAPPASQCVGENCREASPPPDQSVAASATFSGHGNVRPVDKRCPKAKRKVRRGGKVRCVPRERRGNHAAKRHRTVGQTGGQGR
jgi:hypothetical protein